MFPEYKGAVSVGMQRQQLDGTSIFVLPNTSGRNANFSYAEMLAAFKSLKRFVENPKPQIPTPKSQASRPSRG
jgi:G:T/U-mismatch repair DNA glycosylase